MCVTAVKKCTAEADQDATKLFDTQPKLATELRAQHNCKCFVSNGCKPSCNVAMYMIWSAGSGMRCKSEPPVYLEASGAYQYGNPYTNRVLPSDLSYDYFPDYPNPAGHIMNVPAVRSRYAADPKTNFEYVLPPRAKPVFVEPHARAHTHTHSLSRPPARPRCGAYAPSDVA